MQTKIKNFEEFKNQLVKDDSLQNQFKQDPVTAIEQFSLQGPLSNDNWIYRIIVLTIGLTLLAIIVGVILLTYSGRVTSDQGIPTIFTAIGSAAVGALAGLLAPPNRRS
jgi:hypothetical protein